MPDQPGAVRSAARFPGVAVLLGLLAACGGDGPGQSARELAGPIVLIGEGSAHAWVRLDESGAPEALGVIVASGTPEGAITADPLRLPLPHVSDLAFDHAELAWHAAGHAPSGVFDHPHLDVRFFLVDRATRASFTDTLEAARVPALETLPPRYVPLPLFRPGLGAYWIDPTTAPFTGAPLEAGVAYGIYAGRIVFIEIKLGSEVLRARRASGASLVLPERFPTPVRFPGRWRAAASRGELHVSLEELRWRD